jgi:mono/diheme cytochrome c family protein
MARRALIAVCVAATAALVAGCGSASLELSQNDPDHAGAALFVERCGACHTLAVAGTQGSSTKVTDKENVDGPNFNDRKENVEDVIYAIENGGFSGAIMPENIVTGQEARQVAQFLAKYAGKSAGTTQLPSSAGQESAGD